DVRVRARPGPETRPVELDREQNADVRRVDPEDLPRLQPERVPDDQLAEARESWVGHQTPTRSTRLMKSVALPVFIVERILIAMTYRPRSILCAGNAIVRVFALIVPVAVSFARGRPLVWDRAHARL